MDTAAQGWFQENIDYLLQSIAEIDSLLKSRNIEFHCRYISRRTFQINQDPLKVIFKRFGLRMEDYDLDFSQNILKSSLQIEGYFYIRFDRRFGYEGPGERSLCCSRFSFGITQANGLAANILFEFLVKQFDNVQLFTIV